MKQNTNECQMVGTVRHKKLQMRINRIVGQTEGIQRMIAEERYCVDIVNQAAAARSALDALIVDLLSTHLETCVVGHGSGGEHAGAPAAPEERLAEVQKVLSRLLK